ncbi:RtcB family protein [Phytoactinopolyspora halotolerans]|uniref:tRNA-splicing ligase RtcB n=1 Tax=Phytoactinopolyspora halotolerans TaxID=1981512 RepID=A0A6L9SF01_9ACTN|nr:RtcB family protein [Phytoactinopolyspora halotolerans]NEE03168.1 RtcB family protein [Phytoactinopolyspora halotolerans]
MDIVEERPYRFRVERHGDMRVPGVVFASRALIPDARADKSLEQVANVATLPGIVEASYAMPDIHWGYGFPIGGVAATDVTDGGVVSPGGVGFDISCGVRLLAADLTRDRMPPPVLNDLMDRLDEGTPRGLGKGAVWPARDSGRHLRGVLESGARYLVELGHGVRRDLDRCEDGGGVADAQPEHVSARAIERGRDQLGSLGSGNHFLEVQVVDEVHDERIAAAFGLRAGQVCVMIHCGSRGLGHQVCTDHVRTMERTMGRYGITVPDRQLACVPVDSSEGRAYMGAMAAAANYGRANRHLLGESVRRAFHAVAGTDVELVYDVSHNLAKLERHQIDGRERELCVHRKGATRALPPAHPELPGDLATVGQPVLIPGTMGTSSYVLAGVPGGGAFYSTCHGAGRVQSRNQAAKAVNGRTLRDQMEAGGVAVRGTSWKGLAEEAPTAYKDVSEVVTVSERAGLAALVARLVPIGVLKG